MTIDLDKIEALAMKVNIGHSLRLNSSDVLQWIVETRAKDRELTAAANLVSSYQADLRANADKLRVAVEALKQVQLVVMEFATRMDVPPEDEETRAMMKRIGNGVTKALATLSAPTGAK